MSDDVTNSDPIIGSSASDLAERIRAGDLSAVDVVEAHIERIEEVNPALNAVVITLFDEARAQPRSTD